MKRYLKQFINFSLLLAIMSNLTSCEKFFEVERDTSINRPPLYVDDYESMLNQRSLTELDFLLSDLMSDDVYFSDQNRTVSSIYYMHNAYLWDYDFYDNDDQDVIYRSSYINILQLNIIISKVLAAPGGSIDVKERLHSEARIQRAWHYLQLINIYSAGYGSDNSRLGVPLVTLPDADINIPKRATIKEVYDLILSDLNEVVNSNSLPIRGKDLLHPGKLAAMSLLSRVYLLMGDFDNALKYANEVLDIENGLLSYNEVDLNKESLPRILTEYANNPKEILFLKVAKNSLLLGAIKEQLSISDDLYAIYNTNDLRVKLNFDVPTSAAQKVKYKRYNAGTVLYSNMSITVPEIMLIKAECLARRGEGVQAISLVNELASNRFSPENFVPIDINASNALQIVLEERRRELFLRGGLRLFDLKRLNKESDLQKVIERKDNKGSVIASLSPNSNRYIMPFAPIVLFANPNIIQNER